MIKIRPEDEHLLTKDDDLTKLIESIKEHGVIQPLIVNDKYYLVSGFRRYRACLALGITDIPVIVMKNVDFDVVRFTESSPRPMTEEDEFKTIGGLKGTPHFKQFRNRYYYLKRKLGL